MPGGAAALRVCDRSGWDAATLGWSSCHERALGSIWQISIADHRQRQGLEHRMVHRALHGAEGHEWSTTGQPPEAQGIFPAPARETGAAFGANGGVCIHIKAADHTLPQASHHWHVERPHARQNAFYGSHAATNAAPVINVFVDLADTIITVHSSIRQARTTHRWDERPTGDPGHGHVRAGL